MPDLLLQYLKELRKKIGMDMLAAELRQDDTADYTAFDDALWELDIIIEDLETNYESG